MLKCENLMWFSNVILTVLHDSSESEENSKNDLPEDQEESELRWTWDVRHASFQVTRIIQALSLSDSLCLLWRPAGA
jgi:hypothetical protein